MQQRELFPYLLGCVLVFGPIVACGGNTDSDSSNAGGASAAGGSGASGGSGGGSGGIDCSRVGCGPPPMCDTGCTETCGCCSCGEGATSAVDGGLLVCTGGCYTFVTGSICGGLAGVPCAAGEFCDFPPNASCGGDDSTGICLKSPAACDSTGCIGVCGCDGKVYCDECAAHAAGTDVSSSNTCLVDGGAEECGPGGVCVAPGTPCPAGMTMTQLGCSGANGQAGSCCEPPPDPGG